MGKPLAAVAVIGPFKPDDADCNTEKAVQTILEDAHKFSDTKYGKLGYYWVTLSTQLGFCRYVLNYCRKHGIRCVSIDTILMHFSPPINHVRVPFGSEEDLRAIFQCKHAAVMELADYLFIKCYNKQTNMDDLIDRVKRSIKPFCIFNEENIAIEYRGDTLENAKRETQR